MRKFEFVERLKASYPVTRLCRVLGVSPSGYWAWRSTCKREPSPRMLADTALQQRIVAIHAASRATYGAPRIHAAHSRRVMRERAALLPQAGGAPDASGRSSRLSPSAFCHDPARSRASDPARPIAPDLLQRTFIAVAPNHVWVADLTYVPTRAGLPQGFLFLAIVLDACSRRIVGWSMASHLRAELVLAALDMALQHRRPAAGVIHHSDHGPWQPIHGSRVPAAVSPGRYPLLHGLRRGWL